MTVRGPTPPSRGVMAVRSVLSLMSSEMSPFRTPFSEAVPASTITVPGLTMELSIRCGIPVAVTMMS